MTPRLIRCLDLETTGEEPEVHPIEIGYSDIMSTEYDLVGDPIAWRWEDMDGALVACAVPVSAETSAVHHLTDADLVGAAQWADVWPRMVRESPTGLEPSVYVAHSAKSDRALITDDMTGGKAWICTYKCALRLWPESPRHSLQVLRYWRKPQDMARRYASPAHRAQSDAYVTSFLLIEMLKEASVADLIKWSSEPALLPRVTFGQHRGKAWTDVGTGLLEWVLARDFDEDTLYTAQFELDRRREADRRAQEEWERERT